MAEFVPGKVTKRRRRAALQAALFTARQRAATTTQAIPTSKTSTTLYLKYPIPTALLPTLGNPTDGQTLTLNGTVITFVGTLNDPSGYPRFPNMVLIGANLAATLANLLTRLTTNASTLVGNNGTAATPGANGTQDQNVAKCSFAIGNSQTFGGKPLVSPSVNMLTITIPANTPFEISTSARSSAPVTEGIA